MGVSVADTCKKLLDPDVPQALRLQAILVGGVVVVYHKQSLYLLEDCNEMLVGGAEALPGCLLHFCVGRPLKN